VPITQSMLLVGFGALGGEPQFSANKLQAMRAPQSSEVDDRQRFLIDQVDDGNGVVRAAAIIGDVGGFPIRGSNDFMRIGPGGNLSDNREVRRINDEQGLLTFRKHEQGCLWSLGSVEQSRRAEK
jgi:hypothetical protein